MNREMKFRAWIENLSVPFMAIQGEPDLETLSSFMHHYSHAENLMQFSGLKDKNGVEIYEGDIVNFTRSYGNWAVPSSHGYITDTCVVVFDQDCCRFALNYKSNIQKLRKHHGYEYEVIGNIYENNNLINIKDGKEEN